MIKTLRKQQIQPGKSYLQKPTAYIRVKDEGPNDFPRDQEEKGKCVTLTISALHEGQAGAPQQEKEIKGGR